MIIAIDFDGTVVSHEFPYIGALKPNVGTVIRRLKAEGHYICIWTCRTSQFDPKLPKDSQPTIWHVKDFLEQQGIPFDTINHNVPSLSFQPSPKIYADIYIDDKQIGGIPDDWEEIYELIHARKVEILT